LNFGVLIKILEVIEAAYAAEAILMKSLFSTAQNLFI